MPTRREFLFAAGLLGADVLLNACSPKRPQKPVPSTTPNLSRAMQIDALEKKLGIQFDETTWYMLPATTRVQLLQTGQYFDVEQLQGDRRKAEMAQALAEFYADQTACGQSPEDLAKSVSFVNSDEFMKEVNFDAQDMMTEKRKEYLETSGIYYVTHNGKILINNGQLLKKSMELKAEDKKYPDIQDLYEREVLLAAYAEKTMTHESVDIPPTEFDINSGSTHTTFVFNRMRGFDLIGTQDGKPIEVQGLKTIVAQYELNSLITHLNIATNATYQSSDQYQIDKAFLDTVLKQGDIDYDTFSAIANGRGSIQNELLPALGIAHNTNQTPSESATAKLTGLGLAGEGYIHTR